MNLSVNDCKKRWERLRQYYSKERQKQDFETRSGSERVGRKQWKLYNAMTFLNDHMIKRNTFTNFCKNILDESNKRRFRQTEISTLGCPCHPRLRRIFYGGRRCWRILLSAILSGQDTSLCCMGFYNMQIYKKD